MLRTILFIHFILCGFYLQSQNGYPCFSIIESVDENAPLETGNLIWLVEDAPLDEQIEGIWINGTHYGGLAQSGIQFESKLILRAYLKCIYDFEKYDETDVFLVAPFLMSDNQITYIISAENSAYFYLIYEGYEYLMQLCQENEVCRNTYYKQAQLDTTELVVKLKPDLVSVEISEAQFETVTEQVLVKDGAVEFEVVPAVFESQEKTFYVGDSLSCPNEPQTYTFVSDSVLIHDSYNILLVTPSVFETVTEQVLIHDAYTHVDTTFVTSFDTTIAINLRPQYHEYNWSEITDNCQSLAPFDCMNMDSILIDSFSINLDIETTRPCPDDYIACGNMCLQFTGIPPIYEQRTYERLIEIAAVGSVTVPAEYYHFMRKDITSSNTPDSCIVALYDTVTQEILSHPATIIETELPALYGTRSYQKLALDLGYDKTIVAFDTSFTKINLIANQELGQGSIICDEIIIEPLKSLILNKLLELNYLNDETIEYGSSSFWDALFRFQSDHDLRIGSIDQTTLNVLDIE